MKTEEQYVDELIEKYYPLSSMWNFGDDNNLHIKCAIIDVTNTIEALGNLSHRVDAYAYDSLKYYNNVLQILKDKL